MDRILERVLFRCLTTKILSDVSRMCNSDSDAHHSLSVIYPSESTPNFADIF